MLNNLFMLNVTKYQIQLENDPHSVGGVPVCNKRHAIISSLMYPDLILRDTLISEVVCLLYRSLYLFSIYKRKISILLHCIFLCESNVRDAHVESVFVFVKLAKNPCVVREITLVYCYFFSFLFELSQSYICMKCKYKLMYSK